MREGLEEGEEEDDKRKRSRKTRPLTIFIIYLHHVGGVFPMGAGGVQCSDDGCGNPLGDADWDRIGPCVLLSRFCVSSYGRAKADPDAEGAVQTAACAGGCRGRIHGGG